MGIKQIQQWIVIGKLMVNNLNYMVHKLNTSFICFRGNEGHEHHYGFQDEIGLLYSTLFYLLGFALLSFALRCCFILLTLLHFTTLYFTLLYLLCCTLLYFTLHQIAWAGWYISDYKIICIQPQMEDHMRKPTAWNPNVNQETYTCARSYVYIHMYAQLCMINSYGCKDTQTSTHIYVP